ncbi:flagellar hook-associated protein FlgK [Chitinibacter bivalviorum]|uniref:Flagellar hook-associated protein 1 n=1 Tax=Chitinibacter bivalviorum TaxID=2739434 RepID=A0A7H9BJE8_9NEIS|nr:flagellar hook-associated protein FlgK [Chitinibacter bivalviorum]QLG88131.1 flagellar hook-associated protein FlgK [Chitinibacter bivalviorum]
MASSVFGIGVSGLNAANLGLTTTGHNIANVNTDGFSRQVMKQSAPYPLLSGSGFNGLGVQVDSIVRMYDRFLTKSLEVSQSQASYQATRLSHLSEIDNIVADPSAGVSPALQDFFKSVQNVATNPADPPSRQAMISSAQTLVNRFQVFSQRLEEQRNSLNGEVTDTITSINSYSQQIADLNGKIVIAQTSGQPPNDLLDQRDLLVKDLNKLVKANTLTLSDGSINVFIGNGQGLVVGGSVNKLIAAPNPADPQRITVGFTQNNQTIFLPENQLSGGQLGALLDFRSQSLDLAQNSLERTALGFVDTFNQQHKAGQDLYGNMGRNLFDIKRSNYVDLNVGTAPGTNIRVTSPNGTSESSDFSITPSGAGFVIKRLSDGLTSGVVNLGSTDPITGLTLAAAPAGTVPPTQNGFSFPPAVSTINSNTNNTGTAQLTGYITDVGKLSTSNYEFSFDGTNYTMYRQSDGARTIYSAAQVAQGINLDGMNLQLSPNVGAMNAGDRFVIKPLEGMINTMAVRTTDPKEIAAAAPMLATVGAANTGSLKVSQHLVDTPSVTSTDPAVNPAIRNPVTINFTSASSFTYTDTVTGVTSAAQTYNAGMTLSVNGWSMKLDGVPAAGDSIAVNPNIGSNADNRNALALGKLQSTRILDGGSATYQESYGRMVSTIGTQTNEATIMSKAQNQLLTNAQNSRDSVSAVNLDEEAANLLRYQQAYQASSKVIQIAQSAFQEILNIGR